jgi:MFS family permease
VLALPAFVIALDFSVLNLAVPEISRQLMPSATELLWIVDIYGFMLAGFLVTMGTLGDRIGRRRLLMIGAAGFGLASVAAAYSVSAGMLIGGSLVTPLFTRRLHPAFAMAAGLAVAAAGFGLLIQASALGLAALVTATGHFLMSLDRARQGAGYLAVRATAGKGVVRQDPVATVSHVCGPRWTGTGVPPPFGTDAPLALFAASSWQLQHVTAPGASDANYGRLPPQPGGIIPGRTHLVIGQRHHAG